MRNLLLDGGGGLVGDERGLVVVDLAGVDDDPHLSSGAHCQHALDARVARRDLLQVAEAGDIFLERFTSSPRPRAGYRVRRLHDHRFDRLRLDLVVVGRYRVRHRLGLALPARDAGADGRVGAVDLVADRLAQVVKERGAPGRLDVRAELARDQRGEVGALDEVVEDVLAVARAEAQLAEQLARARGSSPLTCASSAARSPSSTIRVSRSSRTCS